MRKIAIISAILEDPAESQMEFNSIVSGFKGIIKGRIGIPFTDEAIAVISITVVGTVDEINSLTGKLGSIPSVVVKTAISKKEVE